MNEDGMVPLGEIHLQVPKRLRVVWMSDVCRCPDCQCGRQSIGGQQAIHDSQRNEEAAVQSGLRVTPTPWRDAAGPLFRRVLRRLDKKAWMDALQLRKVSEHRDRSPLCERRTLFQKHSVYWAKMSSSGMFPTVLSAPDEVEDTLAVHSRANRSSSPEEVASAAHPCVPHSVCSTR